MERAGDDLPLECPHGVGGILVAAPVPDHTDRTADIRDAQLFPASLNVFHGPGGYLACLSNFDKTHTPNSPFLHSVLPSSIA